MIKPVGDVAPWWEGGTFMTTLDELPELERNKTAPLRLPILSKCARPRNRAPSRRVRPGAHPLVRPPA